MNDFKQEILAAISSHPMVTSLDLMGEMMLDDDLKPKLARSLSELKKEGYLTSVKGESGLLEWSIAENAPMMEKVCPKPYMKFDIRKVVDEKVVVEVVGKQEKETDYVPDHAVIGYKHSGSGRVFGTIDECLDDAKAWVTSEMESVNVYQVMVKPIAKYDCVPASVNLNWID